MGAVQEPPDIHSASRTFKYFWPLHSFTYDQRGDVQVMVVMVQEVGPTVMSIWMRHSRQIWVVS